MEVSKAPQGGSSVQKSQTAMSESSQESSVQKTAVGQLSSSVATSKNVSESVEKSVLSSIQVQKSSVTSAPNSNSDDSNDEKIEEEAVLEEEAEEVVDDASSSSTEVIIVRKIVRKKNRTPDTGKITGNVDQIQKNVEEVSEESKDVLKKEEKKDESGEEPQQIKKPDVGVTDGNQEEEDIETTTEKEDSEESENESVEESADEESLDDQPKSETERVEAKETKEAEVEPETIVSEHKIQIKEQLQVPEEPSHGEIKQDNIKATIHEIISDIDRQITEEAAPEPSHPKVVVEQPTAPPMVIQPQREAPSDVVQPEQRIPGSPPKIPTATSMANDDARDDKENGPREVDLQKIFTPASDAEEILPSRQRKLYASSSFYSPVLHPTVEDQVELARRISHSLSDISNQHSKGQSMYVNRKKRSVKWVHEGEGRGIVKMYTSNVSHEETTRQESHTHQDKLPLKLVMNPRGQVQDLETLKKKGILFDPAPQSPERCAEVVNALQATGGKGAELFAKRRKKSEKWVVEETSRSSQSTTPTANMEPVTPTFTHMGVQIPQQNFKFNQNQEKYTQPRVKIMKSPWQLALEGGSVEPAFHEAIPPPRSLPTSPKILPQQRSSPSQAQITRDLAYRPSVPQGWNAPRPHLPLAEEPGPEKEPQEPLDVTSSLENDPDTEPTLEDNEMDYRKVPVKALIHTFEKKTGIYTPPELPINSYAPPPRVDLPPPQEPPMPIKRTQAPPPLVPHVVPPVAPPRTPKAPQLSIYTPHKTMVASVIQMPPQSSSCVPANKWRNYNTAARGWRGADVYRPVTFDQTSPQLPFTDF